MRAATAQPIAPAFQARWTALSRDANKRGRESRPAESAAGLHWETLGEGRRASQATSTRGDGPRPWRTTDWRRAVMVTRHGDAVYMNLPFP